MPDRRPKTAFVRSGAVLGEYRRRALEESLREIVDELLASRPKAALINDWSMSHAEPSGLMRMRTTFGTKSTVFHQLRAYSYRIRVSADAPS